MTLKEKFKIINCNDCDMPYCEIKCTILKPSELNHLEKIADEFAIGFAEWLLKFDNLKNENKYIIEQLLEIYKETL